MATPLEISFDPARMDFAETSRLIRESYWGAGRTDELNRRAFAHSICAVALLDGRQVGFGRAAGDRTAFARISDVLVWPGHRGRGIGQAIVRALLEHPELRTVTTWSLNTADAHGLYTRFGFRVVDDGRTMELRR